MRLFLWFSGLFAAATGLAVLVRYNVGNVVIFFPPYRIDFSLNFFLLVLFLLLFVMYLIMRIMDAAKRLPIQVSGYRKKKREDEDKKPPFPEVNPPADGQRETLSAALFSPADIHDAESVRRCWQKIPEADRMRPDIAVCAAAAFSSCGLDDDARSLLEEAVASGFDERLIRAYRALTAQAGSEALSRQIENCETWTGQYPENPELMLTLGAFCFREERWDRAQDCLDSVIGKRPAPAILGEAHLLLAQLHETLERQSEAAEHYKASALAKAG